MARKPTQKTKFSVGDEVLLRGRVTIVRVDGDREWVTVLVRGFEQMPITTTAEHAEKAPE